MFEFTAQNESETHVLAKALATALPTRLSIGLIGTLGAGKTFFAGAIASCLNIDPTLVVSPTFTVCNEYSGDRRIFHFDFYRIQDEDELLELGVEETFESNAICLIEWADRFADSLPADFLQIEIDVTEDNHRIFSLLAHGEISQAVIDAVSRQLET